MIVCRRHARRTAYYASPACHLRGRAVVLLGRAHACGRDHCDGFMEDNPDYYFAHNTCEEIQAQPEIAESCATWSGECNGGCIAELEAWYGCAFAPCSITCGFGKGKKKDEPDAASAAVLDFVAFFVLGSLALATLAGAACASARRRTTLWERICSSCSWPSSICAATRPCLY